VSGEPDPLYVLAREILLDALEALGEHRASLTLVGAQAIYLHTGEADIAVAPFTTDADVVIDPAHLADHPILGEALAGAGFIGSDQPGQWTKNTVRVDLMVPASVAGTGRRGVRLGAHGNRAARKARGLEGALVDHAIRSVESLAGAGRTLQVSVAGPAALLVSKLHKLAERADEPSRLKDKDALDVLRLLRGAAVATLSGRLHLLTSDPRSTEVAIEAVEHLDVFFSRPDAVGSMLAARAAEGLDDPATIRASCAALASDVLAAFRDRH
jgi:hypothetical protein